MKAGGAGREKGQNNSKKQTKGHIAFMGKILGLVRKFFKEVFFFYVKEQFSK